MRLQRAHLTIGLLTLAVFLGTGQYILAVAPPGQEGGELTHTILTATHIYVMFTALMNVTLGLHMRAPGEGMRGVIQKIGSLMLIASPPVMVAAFFMEGEPGLLARPVTTVAAFLAFFGTGAHVLARVPLPTRSASATGNAAPAVPSPANPVP